MSIIYFVAVGAITLFLLQFAMKWQQSKGIKLPWYSWVLAVISYLMLVVSIPLVYTLAGEAVGGRPAAITALIAAIVFVVFVALTRQSIILFQKKKQVSDQKTAEAS